MSQEEDLGGPKKALPFSPTAPSKNDGLLLEKQTYRQRTCIFWAVLLLCVFLYGTFFYFVFCSGRYFQLVCISGYVTAVATALLILPTILMWGLTRAVYRSTDKPEEPDPLSAVEKILQLMEKFK